VLTAEVEVVIIVYCSCYSC